MWRIFILINLVQISLLFGKPLENFEDNYWQSETFNIPSNFKSIIRQLSSSTSHENQEKENLMEREVQVKRGFSLFARMRPFSSVAKTRTSIRHPGRSINNLDSFNPVDIVSAEKHAHNFRPVGQPLRWG